MANIKISDLTAAAAASGTQEFEVNDSLTSKKVTGAQLLAYAESNMTLRNNVVTTSSINDKAVTLGKMADMATASVLGRNTAGSGSPEVLSASTARTLIGADNASNLTTGTVGTARLASGTANSTTFLRGDQTWATVTSLPGAQGQVFTSSGTFTIPSGITAVKVTVVGGGGGGAGKTSGCGEQVGGGGGGGGFSTAWVTGLTPGNTVSVTVGAAGTAGGNNANGGAGGTSSFGAYASATGGGAGLTNSNAGAGGSGSGGSLNISGVRVPNIATNAGGQAIMFGMGARAPGTNQNGVAASGYGAGGSGANSTGSAQSGGAGTAGLVIVEW